jgi:phytoene/squalene synthetase
MKLDLIKSDYNSKEEYDDYIYGSAGCSGIDV